MNRFHILEAVCELLLLFVFNFKKLFLFLRQKVADFFLLTPYFNNYGLEGRL